jgi:NADPH:quinone reductase
MRAVVADHAGPPDVLHIVELDDPIPGPHQVLVQVELAAITFIETRMRAGASIGPPVSFPVVLGNGVGGRVVALGDGVDRRWLGVEVVTGTGGRGGYATLALAADTDLHRLPDGVDLDTGLALLADGRTAVGLARAARIRPGETVVVTAAGGGVGSLLVQLATRAGGRVVALAGSDVKLALARGLEAAAGVNYRHDDWAEELFSSTPAGVDVAFDGVGGSVSATIVGRLNRHARYLPHGGAGGAIGRVPEELARRLDITTIPLSEIGRASGEMHELTEEALTLAARGTLRPTIGQRFALDEAAAAHAAIENRATTGKTLLRVG